MAGGTLLGCVLVAVIATHASGRPDGLGYRISFQWVAFAGVVLAGAGAWRRRKALAPPAC